MNKREFAGKLLKLFTRFEAAAETQRKKIGREIANFYRKNYRFSDGTDAFTDRDLGETTFAVELGEYRKACFPEEDFLRAKWKLEKMVKRR